MRRTLLLVSIVTSTLAGLLFLIASLTVPPVAATAVELASVEVVKPAAQEAELRPIDVTSLVSANLAEPMVRLRKNPLYYDAQNVSIAEINNLLIGQDEAWNRYRSGEFDTIAPPAFALPVIKGSAVYGPQLHTYSFESVSYVGFSTDIPPLDDPLLRAALASAIDRPRLINETQTGDEAPALTLTPPGSFGHVDGYAANIGHPYSPVAAANFLGQSQYRSQPLTLTVNIGRLPQASLLKQMWFETLGISVTLQALDFGSYLDLMNNGTVNERPHIFMAGWIADYPDANNFHSDILVTGSNWPRYNNPIYDEIVLAAASEVDPAFRPPLYEQAETLLVMNDTAIAPLFYGVDHRLTRPDLNRTYRGYGAQHFDEWSFDLGAERPLLRSDSSDPQILDPAQATGFGEIDYIEGLFLGLTDYDPIRGEAVPELATGWQVSADGLAYTFTLRSDALWTDGLPVTASDVEYGVLRSLDPAWGPNHFPGTLLYIIQNAELYQSGIVSPSVVGVNALDASHIRFDLERPATYFPILAGLWPARPVPQRAIQLYGNDWTRPDHIVTNGPYKLVSFNINDADLGVIKLDSADPVPVHEPMTYTLIVYNDGPVSATRVSLQDTLPLGVSLITGSLSAGCSIDVDIFCFWSSIAPNDVRTASFSVVPNVVGTIYNRAVVSAVEFDGNTVNDRALEATQVVDVLPTSPILHSITPRYGLNVSRTQVIITGANFQPGIQLKLIMNNSLIPLLVNRVVSEQELEAEVPAGLMPGTYHLLALNPDGQEDLLPSAFTVVAPAGPEILAVRPSAGPNDVPVIIDIYGENFAPDATAYLQSGIVQGSAPSAIIPLDSLLYVNSTLLRAVVPRNTPPATYRLVVINPGGVFGQLSDAYKVLDASTFEDLFADASNLWLRPPTVRAGEPISMGLVVHRRSPLTRKPVSVTVDFYDGLPTQGGQPIGNSTALVPAAGHNSTTPIVWTPQQIGSRLLCAVIDPLNNISEVHEDNNQICRLVRVLPQLPDTTPPTILSFTVNDGERLTREPWVSLDVIASDDSRLSRVLYVEYALNLGGFWDQVAVSEWLPYESSTVDYSWRLYPSPGVHYFKACVADFAGNIGCSGLQPIAYLPDSSYLVEGEVHVYRRLLEPGTYEVQLTILSGGMADLYVWDTDWQNTGPIVVMTDVVAYQAQPFTVINPGLHQLEVEATQGNVLYRLDLIPLSSALGPVAGPMSPTSPAARFTPFVGPEDTPTEDESGLPSAPTGAELYLPLMLRD